MSLAVCWDWRGSRFVS